jgi:hypothetical protein
MFPLLLEHRAEKVGAGFLQKRCGNKNLERNA